MNRHQLNGVQSFLEILDSAADRGIVLSPHVRMDLQVDGTDTGLTIWFDSADGQYTLESYT